MQPLDFDQVVDQIWGAERSAPPANEVQSIIMYWFKHNDIQPAIRVTIMRMVWELYQALAGALSPVECLEVVVKIIIRKEISI